MLDYQNIPISLGQGIDTKTDPKAVQGKLISLVDGVFTSPNRISKRNGYDALGMSIYGGGTITSPLMTASYNNELICADGTSLYGYSPSTGTGLFISKGSYQSVSVKSQKISNYPNGLSNQSIAVLGNYVLSSFSSSPSTVSPQPFYSLWDQSEGSFLIKDAPLSTGNNTVNYTFTRSVLLSGTTLGVIYLNTSNNLVIRIITITSSGPSLGTEIILASNVGSADGVTAYFDYVSDGTNNYLAYPYASATMGTPLGMEVIKISSTGSILATRQITSVSLGFATTCQIDASGNVWVYWADWSSRTNENLYYFILNSTLTSTLLGKTSIVAGLSYISQISVSIQGSGNQRLYYSTNTQDYSSPSPNYTTTLYAELSTSGVVSTGNTFLLNLEVQSNFISFGGVNYAVFANNQSGRTLLGNQTQNTYFLVSESTKNAVAKCLYASAIGAASANNTGVQKPDLFLVGSKLYFGARYLFYVDESAFGSGTGSPSYAFDCIIFDFEDFEAYQSVLVGNTLVLNGGIVQIYDGKTVSELGFNVYPENVVASIATTGGFMGAGVYSWAAVYEWYDNNGNFHQSTPKFIQATTTGSTNSATITVQTLTLSQKLNPTASSVNITLYRTTAGETIYYKIKQIVNDITNPYVTFSDGFADSSILTGSQLYTDGGVVENIAPPPSMVLMSNQNRLWLVDSEKPSNTIWYSKTYAPGVGISTSDLLTLTIDSKLGNITSLIGMDEKTCILKEFGVFISVGDGADDTGQNATFSNPQVVPSDTGALYSRGTVLIPDGVIYKSSKGLYLLGRGLNVSYFGAEAEAYNSQDIQSALIAPSTSQLRILTSSGSTLVYDYIFKQWSTFSNHTGYSACVWNDTYVYVRTDGKIYKENATTFLDSGSAYSLKATLAWLKLAGIQGFQRIRRLGLLGDHSSSNSNHGVSISPAYDYVPTYGTTVPFVIGSGTGPYQYRERLLIQKCEAISLLIQEVTTGVSGEYLNLTDLSLEVGLKKGINKLPLQKSVG